MKGATHLIRLARGNEDKNRTHQMVANDRFVFGFLFFIIVCNHVHFLSTNFNTCKCAQYKNAQMHTKSAINLW